MDKNIYITLTIFAIRKNTLVNLADITREGPHKGWVQIAKTPLLTQDPNTDLHHLLQKTGLANLQTHTSGWIYVTDEQKLTLNWWAVSQEVSVSEPYFWTPSKVGSWPEIDQTCKNNALAQLQNLINTRPVPEAIHEPFTLTQLQKMYEVIWDTTLDGPNFRKKIFATKSIKKLEEQTQSKRGRPATLYQWSTNSFESVLYKNLGSFLNKPATKTVIP